MTSPVRAHLDILVKDAKVLVLDALADGILDVDEVLRIAMFVAEKANVLQGLSGPERRRLVIRAVELAVKSAVPSEQAEQVGSNVALRVLPSVLDIAVSAARGKISLGKVLEAPRKWSLAYLLGCFGHFWMALVSRKPEAVVEALEREVLEPVKFLSESANQQSEIVPPVASGKGNSLESLSQMESNPVASVSVVPLEIRPPEAVSPELPNTANPDSVLEPRLL